MDDSSLEKLGSTNGDENSVSSFGDTASVSTTASVHEMQQELVNVNALLNEVGGDISETTSLVADEIVSEEALEEQKKIMKKIMKEEEERKKKLEKEKQDQEMLEKRYKRLLDLLGKSQLYSEYLKSKIDEMKTLPSPVKKGRRVKAKENVKGKKEKRVPLASLSTSDDETPNQDSPKTSRSMSFEECKMKQPSLLENVTMRPYQVEGYEWLKSLATGGLSGILADEMGLGKTLQCIANICNMIELGVEGPFLVVAPLSTLSNWVNEFRQFAPKIPVILYHGSYDKRAELASQFDSKYEVDGLIMLPVVITSYELIITDVKVLSRPTWKYLVIDEGHRIKNYQSRLAAELKKYKSVNRLLLTGTPLQNDLAELWSLLNFLMPEIFDDLDVFQAWFDLEELNAGNNDILEREKSKHIINTLHKILQPFLLRRVKSDVAIDLPPKKELIVYCPMAPKQAEMYNAIVDRTIFEKIGKKEEETTTNEVNERGRPKRKAHDVSFKDYFNERNSEASINQWIKMSEDMEEMRTPKRPKTEVRTSLVRVKMQNPMMMLRKCVNHPFLCDWPLDKNEEQIVDERLVTESGKMRVLDQMLIRLKKGGHKVLIFSQLTMMMDILAEYLDMRGYSWLRLDGSTKLEERAEAIRQFNTDPKTFIFLLSTRAGGLGVNLTGGDTVIIYDSDWNPQADLQAQDRCHRIGQTRPVVVYRYVTSNTIDQRVVERAAAKRRLEKMIIQRGKFRHSAEGSSKTTSIEELQELLKAHDYQGEYGKKQGDAVFTEEEWKALLDRSDMMPGAKKRDELEGVFKRIPANEAVM